MHRIEEVFGRRGVLLPVIHPRSRESALEAVDVAVAAGVDGVFLINQGLSADGVIGLINTIHAQRPELWVGVNLLGFEPAETLRWCLEACEGRLDGIWIDDAAIDERVDAQPRAQAFVDARRELGWTGLYFGGVAFKYQREVLPAKLGDAARKAAEFMDVVCTSGPGTGQAADIAKVVAMREGLGSDHALALASGVTADNVADYLPHVDAYLVGTGIEVEFGVLDPATVARLDQLIRSRR